jgi:hypothetical protein
MFNKSGMLALALSGAFAAAPLAAHAQEGPSVSQPVASLQNTLGSFGERGTFQKIQITGAEESMSGSNLLLTNGNTVVITDGTRIDRSALRPGAKLHIVGSASEGGTIVADEITGE